YEPTGGPGAPGSRGDRAQGGGHARDGSRGDRARRGGPVSYVDGESASQPACWERAAAVAAAGSAALPRPGERVAVVGCGTSWFIGQAYAALRERAGHGGTDAFAASEYPVDRRYDRVLAITRSGTTTEVLDLLGKL